MLTTVALAAALLVAAGCGNATAAAQPCWRTVIQDWYDGKIDGNYSASCYREALKNAPDDLRMYSDLPEDLDRALQTKARSLSGIQHAAKTVPSKAAANGRNKPRGPVGRVLEELGPKRADSVPIPLLVLASLALLLIAAGAGGLVTRRLAARRVKSRDD